MAPHNAVFLTLFLAVGSLAAAQDAAVAINAMPPVAKPILVVQAPLNGSGIVLSTDAAGNLVLTSAASGAGSPAQAPAPGASMSQSLPRLRVPASAAPSASAPAHAPAGTPNIKATAPASASALPASPSPRPANPAEAAPPAQAPAGAASSLAAAFMLPHIAPAPASVPRDARATAPYDMPVPAAAQRLALAQSAINRVASELLSAPAQAPALPRAATMHAAVAEAQAALSALHANTAKGLASALNGKALGGIINGTAAVLSGSLPADTIMAVVEAGRNSTGSYVSAPVVHPLRTFGPIEVLAPPNATEPLDFVANVMEDGIGESATELGDAVEHGAASSSKTVKAIIG